MKKSLKKSLGIIISLIILLTFSFYAAEVGPKYHPSTSQILDNPQKFENKKVKMRGTLIHYSTNDNTLTLFLKTEDENFTAKYFEKFDGVENLEKGDIIDLRGYSHFSTKNYIRVMEIKPRPEERHSNMFLFSIVGLGLLLVVTIRDREKIREVLPFG